VVPVIGGFNLSNLAVAAACCLAAGIDFSDMAGAIGEIAGVPGRFEVVSGIDPITVIVDYAHTPEAVVRAVETGREMTKGRVIALLGAGGDRDRAKRPAMGAALATADVAIVTSDNPRSEEPETIVSAVLAGVPADAEALIEVDRRRAIDVAIHAAEDGDVVLVLGRGHEPYQHVGDEEVPFDDREVAAESLSRRRSSTDYGPESGSMSP
jgi:UDP-N-acetylmuramoyl-L-alanyl-D-glutamate--2,6-diaminopimelate ligase